MRLRENWPLNARSRSWLERPVEARWVSARKAGSNCNTWPRAECNRAQACLSILATTPQWHWEWEQLSSWLLWPLDHTTCSRLLPGRVGPGRGLPQGASYIYGSVLHINNIICHPTPSQASRPHVINYFHIHLYLYFCRWKNTTLAKKKRGTMEDALASSGVVFSLCSLDLEVGSWNYINAWAHLPLYEEWASARYTGLWYKKRHSGFNSLLFLLT